ncbi:hypothetical protein PGT21_008752 [Puccinia graminis f. sp. tritici]|uniref:Oxidoreductase AflY n=2 Tax=Puccinia graminis f. sp. tritici TaxID=56615 RepID=H6QPJ0_PUCGT|nr:uncharacterized protein PGTG_20857 [Puccinia graminis f. sp. tritici CRL 75-36-700-3]EHS63875.1 hypothetical protein PGTG_20857 [Puccinia graminis f. sp. tritici CRL 75-36-700-3]KAA1117478.1 hypothetical protein PGT21_008752 [Puccinia graminis f. sp. tritici]
MSSKDLSTDGGLSKLSVSHRSSFTPNTSVVINFPAENRHQTANLIADLLSDNHVKYHCFFNEKRFHNHIVHHILALYSLGADGKAIQASYDREAPTQKPIGGVDNENITAKNWTSFLGQAECYKNYLDFFWEEVKKKGAVEAVQEYIFGNPESQMLNRTFSGVLHPLIHWGYGLEFKIDAIVAEGLAITAVHGANLSNLKLSELLTKRVTNGASKGDTSNGHQKEIAPSFDFRCEETNKTFKPKTGLSAFQILHKISQETELPDPSFQTYNTREQFSMAAEHPALVPWLDKWEIEDDCDWKEILERTKELIWMVAVIYTTSYDKEKGKFALNFFLMHLVTSSLFLPAILPYLDQRLRPTLLKAFFKTAICIWVGQGRFELRISECLKEPSFIQVPDSQNPGESENPWYKVLESAAKHPDEHTTKIIRALYFNANTYGSSQPGYYSCDLKGSELLDSTLFLRASIMTLNKLEWSGEGAMDFKWY